MVGLRPTARALTRRADVAFWLHLLAAPMIVHPIFTLLGLNNGTCDDRRRRWSSVLLYVALGLTALAIDRRALLVSALAYVLYALTELFKQFGAVELNVALTALIIGSALLLLSAFWHQARAAVVTPLPCNLQDRLPILDRTAASQPTSRMSRRSSGARTGASSWPRLSTSPCSPTNANAPCFSRSAGRFSMRTSGRSRMAAVGREHRHVGIDPKRVIAPVPGRDHPPVEVEDADQFPAIESGDWAPVPRMRERRNDAQALFTFGWGWRARLEHRNFLAQLLDLLLELADAARGPGRNPRRTACHRA